LAKGFYPRENPIKLERAGDLMIGDGSGEIEVDKVGGNVRGAGHVRNRLESKRPALKIKEIEAMG
jgi:hypothetical protein